MSWYRIVACDPGYRNLGTVVIDYDVEGKQIMNIASGVMEVGTCNTDGKVISRLWEVLDREKLFASADHVIIENQMIGPKTKPRNQGIAYLLATMALNQSPNAEISFMSAKKKFSEFKADCPEAMSSRDSGAARRKKLKRNSIALSKKIILEKYEIDPVVVFPPQWESKWDHIADALGMAFVFIKKTWP